MRVVIADCSAIYSGRGDTSLCQARRAIIIKEDGSVSIHNDAGNKPLNYMKCATLVESVDTLGAPVWTFDARHESLSITLHDILSDTASTLVANDEGLVRDGTEDHLQEWIANHPEVLGEGYTLVRREFPTGNGPVDLLVLDAEGKPVAVEVKRVAMLGAVDQVRRYVEALKADVDPDSVDADIPDFHETTGIIAALDVRPRTQELADKRGFRTVTIPPTWRN